MALSGSCTNRATATNSILGAVTTRLSQTRCAKLRNGGLDFQALEKQDDWSLCIFYRRDSCGSAAEGMATD